MKLRTLGPQQRGVLGMLRDYGPWHPTKHRWTWGSPTKTQRIIDSLVKRGLVKYDNEDNYTLTKVGKGRT